MIFVFKSFFSQRKTMSDSDTDSSYECLVTRLSLSIPKVETTSSGLAVYEYIRKEDIVAATNTQLEIQHKSRAAAMNVNNGIKRKCSFNDKNQSIQTAVARKKLSRQNSKTEIGGLKKEIEVVCKKEVLYKRKIKIYILRSRRFRLV